MTEYTRQSKALLPAIAVIMRSKDEEPYTTPTLKALFSQTYHNFVLYNVDSGSTDGTLEAIKQYNPHPKNIKIIEPGDYIPGRVLNGMIANVREDIVVLLNADCIPQSPTWLETLVQPLLDHTADVVTSRQIARPDAYFIVAYDMERGYGKNTDQDTRHIFFSAAACAFYRNVWEAQQFPEEGWGEDLVWAVRCTKHGARFDLVSDAVVEHSHNYTLKTLYRRERGHGIVHQQALGESPSLIGQGFTCLKHIARDALWSIRKGNLQSIPYNIVYRITFHYALYRGKCAGAANQGFPQEFFRK